MSAPLQWQHPKHGCVDLRLAGLRLRLLSELPESQEWVTAVMVPPCEATPPAEDPDWMVLIEQSGYPCSMDGGTVLDDMPALVFPYGGSRLTIADNAGGRLRALGFYGAQSAPAIIEVDPARHTTTLALPVGDERGVRWSDWLAKVFFASRMLAAGWRILHASAVAVDGVAVLFLAGQRGGKSTLAHRACVALGAAFLADDLVLLAPDGTVVGWPARVAVPADLLPPGGGGTVCETHVDGTVRRRVLLSPHEHRSVLDVAYSPPVPLGVVVSVVRGDVGAPAIEASEMGRDALEAAVTAALEIPSQRLYTTDLLGLMGGPNVASPYPAGRDVATLLAGVAGALLRVGDPTALPTAPVWTALAGVIPHLAVAVP